MYSSYLLFNPASIPGLFKQAWRNKFALGWESLCQVFHPKRVLIGSPLKLFKKQYLMKTNRCTTAECHCKIVNMCHHQVLIAKLKKSKPTLRVMTGKYGCYRSPASTNTIFPAERSSYAQRERASVSASTCTLTHAAPTPGLVSAPFPAHAAPTCSPIAHEHHSCRRAGHFSDSWFNRKPSKIHRKI